MKKVNQSPLSQKILAAVRNAIASAINQHKAEGSSIIVWSEKKNKVIEIPAARIKKRRLKF